MELGRPSRSLQETHQPFQTRLSNRRECSSWLRTFEQMSWRAEDSAWMEEGACVLEFVVRRVS